jgi:hypothetical protein
MSVTGVVDFLAHASPPSGSKTLRTYHKHFAPATHYGSYNFGFVEAWPVGWGYDDDVYVVYTDGGYYMYNRIHPGLRLSINIL